MTALIVFLGIAMIVAVAAVFFWTVWSGKMEALVERVAARLEEIAR